MVDGKACYIYALVDNKQYEQKLSENIFFSQPKGYKLMGQKIDADKGNSGDTESRIVYFPKATMYFLFVTFGNKTSYGCTHTAVDHAKDIL